MYDDSIIIQAGHTVTISTATQLDQIWVRQGATLNIAAPFILNDGAGIDLQSDGSLIIAAAGNINGNGTLILNGNLDNSASINSNVFVNTNVSGSAAQTITASGGFTSLNITNPAVVFNLMNDITADSLFINNGTGGTVTVSGGNSTSLFTINKKLSFQNGRVIMSNNAVLNIAETAIVQGAGTNSFVEGPVRCNTSLSGISNLFFPVGKEVYKPVGLNVTHSSAGPSIYQAEVLNTAPVNRSLPASINAVASKGYFKISNISSQPVTNAVVTLSYDSDDQVTDKTSLRIAKDDGINSWIDIGGSGTGNGLGTITSAINFTTFGDFALANAGGGANAFAMRWLQTDAKLMGKQVQLTWTIGNEVNVNDYIVERSADGINFNAIITVNATSVVAAEKQYAAADRLPMNGINYYRIKQTTKDGSISYSKILQVSVTETVDFIVWPNPTTTTVNVQNRKIIQQLQCYNSNGQLMYNINPATNQVAIPVLHWAAGIYSIKITSGDNTVQTRFVKQ